MSAPATAKMLADACNGDVIGTGSIEVSKWVRPEDATNATHVSWFRRDRQLPKDWMGGVAIVDRVRPVPPWVTQILVDNARLGFALAATEHQLAADKVTVQHDAWTSISAPVIAPSAILGAPGQGYVDAEGIGRVFIPHLGRVLIHAGARIHAGAVIVRAVLGETVVGIGASVGCNATVGHGATIGDGAHIGAGANIGGSAVIGNDATVWMGATIRNGIKIGDGATIGMGAVVTKNVPAGETWVGNPARPIGGSTTVVVAPNPFDHGPRESVRRVRAAIAIDATIDPSLLHREPYFVGASSVCKTCRSTICEGC